MKKIIYFRSEILELDIIQIVQQPENKDIYPAKLQTNISTNKTFKNLLISLENP